MKQRLLTQKDCDAWNAKHPVGTAVKVRRDNGELQDTKTRSPAEMPTNSLWSIIHYTNAMTEKSCNELTWAKVELRRRGFVVQ